MLLENGVRLQDMDTWEKVSSKLCDCSPIIMFCFKNLLAGPIPLRVREAELPVVSDAECIRKVNAVTEKIFILPASSFCAGGEEGNDACQGDGGETFRQCPISLTVFNSHTMVE